MVAEGLARRALAGLLVAEALLAVLHAGVANFPVPPLLQEFGNLGYEGNLGTWFASTQWAALAFVLLLLWLREGGLWLLLAAGALFLSADEAATIHERLGVLVQGAVSTADRGTLLGWLRLEYRSYYWLLLYVPLAVPAAAVVAVWLGRRMPRHRGMLLAGIALFFAGAVGLDFVEGWKNSRTLEPMEVGGALWDLVLLEEVLELAGVSLVLAACAERCAGRLAPCERGNSASGPRNQ